MKVVFVGHARTPWKVALWYPLTLGISRRIWLVRVTKEIDGHDALALRHGWTLFLAAFPVLTPTILTFLTARRIAAMTGDTVRYGPGTALWLVTLIPILGNLFFLPWSQSRLNRFWTAQRGRRGAGVEIDIDAAHDPSFIVEMAQAHRISYKVGSRFDEGKVARAEKRAANAVRRTAIQNERQAVRDAGGSTPVLPWRRPTRAASRLLKVTCGRCDTGFETRHDPFAETPLVCPKCGLAEVLPSLRGNPLARKQPAGIASLQVDCPSCHTKFRQVRNLRGPTSIACPSCGAVGEVPAPVGVPA